MNSAGGWLHVKSSLMDSYGKRSAPSNLLDELIEYEKSRAPFPRELKRFADFNGVAPHLRPGPLMSMYPTLSVREILSTRAIIAALLAKDYGLSIAEVSKVLRCEEDDYAERLVTVGEELAIDSAVVARMKDIVRRAAKMIVTEAAPAEEAAAVRALLQRPKKAKKKASSTRAILGTAETAQVRCIIVYFLVEEFKFKRANARPLFGYPTREEIRSMECRGDRYLHRCSSTSAEGQRMLTAARAIMAKVESAA